MPLSSIVASDLDAEVAFRKVSRILRVHFRQRRTATVGPDLSNRRTLVNQVLRTPGVRKAIANEAGDDPDALARIDASTFRVLPDAPDTANFLVDFHTQDGAPHPACPRNLLKSVLQRAADTGFSTRFSAEFEFWVFQETPESLHKKGFRGRGLLARFLWAIPESLVGRRAPDAPPVPGKRETCMKALEEIPRAPGGECRMRVQKGKTG